MAVRIVEHEISVVISDDEEPDEMIIDFESLPSIGVTSENEGHEKPNERNFGSQSRPVGNISPVCCFSSDDEIGCMDVEEISSPPLRYVLVCIVY